MALKAKIVAPVLSLILAGGLFSQMQTYAPEGNPGLYHERIARAAEAIPELASGGDWTGTDMEMPPAAGQLLRPNVLFSRHYRRASDGAWAKLIFVQCPDSRDMSGHYPPNCYPGNGWKQGGAAREFQFDIWGRQIPIAEYVFSRSEGGRTYRAVIYDFFVLPTEGFVTSMEQLRRATGDYRARPYGAAQVQVMIDASLAPEQRPEVLREMLELLGPVVDLLQDTKTGES